MALQCSIAVVQEYMPDTPVAAAVRSFVEERIHTLEQLEILLLLHARPSCSPTIAQLAQELRLTPEQVSSGLDGLRAAGLLSAGAQDGCARYQPESAALAAQVDALAAAYQSSRVSLIVLISSNAMDRVRNAGLRAFAQAFLVKGPKKDG